MTSDPERSRRTAGGIATAALGLAGAALVFLQSAAPLGTESAVFDEPLHLAAGWAGLATGDLDLNPEHPPLAKTVAALTLVPVRPVLGPRPPVWDGPARWGYAVRFLYGWNDADRLLHRARWAMVAITAALVIVLFLAARRLLGPTAGVFALVIAAFDPNLLAHGHLVTTDVPLALAFLGTVLAMLGVGRKVTVPRVLLLGTVLGLALATKFSALLLVPLLPALAAVRTFDRSTLPVVLPRGRRSEASTPRARAVVLLLVLAASGVLAWLMLWGAYGFRFAGIRTQGHRWPFRNETVLPDPGPARAALVVAHRFRLLPEAYVVGLGYTLRHSERRLAFLAGEQSRTGWWWYFPFALLVKNPLPLLVLAGAGLGLLARRLIRGPDRFTWACLLLPPGFYLAVSMTSSLNIGYRHLLPLEAFLILAASEGAQAAWKRGGVAWRLAPAALCVWLAVSSALVAPSYLAYFNETVGGPNGGSRYLVDSNVDWGQDLGNLARYARERRIDTLYLGYFGTADPGYYGLRYVALPSFGILSLSPGVQAPPREPGTWIAVSVTLLRGLYLGDPDTYAWLREREPVARIGHSIFVYRL